NQAAIFGKWLPRPIQMRFFKQERTAAFLVPYTASQILDEFVILTFRRVLVLCQNADCSKEMNRVSTFRLAVGLNFSNL
ncbi:MAG: hypothetical protein AAF623_05705, partial [Planctomycetota bacterium]